jgi:deoxyribonuclease-4
MQVSAVVRLGFHVSISVAIDRAVDRAVDLGCDTFQIFTRNPRAWSFKPLIQEEVEFFREKLRRAGIGPIFVHMPYILNLATPDDDVYRRSIDSLAEELKRCTALGAPFLVTHIGSHLGAGAEFGVNRVVEAIDNALSRNGGSTVILLENSSGAGTGLGSSFEEMGCILKGVADGDRVAMCLDICHAFASGYEFRNSWGLTETLEALDGAVGIDRLELVHLNDSVEALGSRIDHHEHIGLGAIGEEGFRFILRSWLAELPMIMETPVDGRREDAGNLDKVRDLLA